jgi:hypothetical protein
LVFHKVNPALSKALLLVSALLGIVVFGAMARTGYLGGQIRHTEIRSGAIGTQSGGESEDGVDTQRENDDD